MPISANLKVDFSNEHLDLRSQARELLLSQFKNSPKLEQFLDAFIQETQLLFDEIIQMQKQRTLFEATGANLDALGMIVGEPKDPWVYSEADYFYADRAAQGVDMVKIWVTNGNMDDEVSPDDTTYRERIMLRIFKNHVLCASVPELTALVHNFYGFDISFIKTGPYTCTLAVPVFISTAALVNLTRFFDLVTVQHDSWMPYPAPLSFDLSGVMFLPQPFFQLDAIDGRQCDSGKCMIKTDKLIMEYGEL